MQKRRTNFLPIVILVISVFAIILFRGNLAEVYASSDETGNFEYEINNGEAKIVRYIGNALEIVVPDTIEGCKVTEIGNYAFEDYPFIGITSITIPKGVTKIGKSAFWKCTELQYISLPEGLLSIGESAFGECHSLVNIDLPKTLTYLGDDAFLGCENLASIVIPDGVSSIGGFTFYRCNSLKIVSLPKNLTYIGSGAFEECTSLNGLDIPEKVTKIESRTFYNCSRLTNVIIPAGVTSIGEEAFYNCEKLKNIDIPNKVTSIGKSAFEFCKQINSVVIPVGVTQIENSTFSCCSGLTNVSILGKVTSIGESAFSGCHSLSSVTIPYGVSIIGRLAFAGCRILSGLEIPSSVTKVGEKIIDGCDTMKAVYLAKGLEIPDAPDSVVLIEYTEKDGKILIPASSLCDLGPEYVVPEKICGKTVVVTGGYNINYNCCNLSVDTKAYGEAFTLPSPSKDGYEFVGWATVDGGTVKFAPGAIYKDNCDITLYAQWVGKTCLVGFSNPSSGGLTKHYGDVITLPTPDKKIGYTFKGWATSYQSTTASYKAGDTYTIKGDITFYGIWEETLHTIIFNGNEGTASESSATVREGDAIGTLPKGTRTNYELEGWYTSASGGTKVTESTAVASDMTLYAHWVGKTCLVGFSNPAFDGLTKHYDDVITLPTPDKKTGYTFKGWATSYQSTTASYKAGDTYTIKGDITFYGIWEETLHTIIFNGNEGTASESSVTVREGDAIGTLPKGTRTNYELEGWYTSASGGTKVTESTAVTSDMTLYAHWVGKTCLVGFSNPAFDGLTKHYGDVITLPTPDKKTGYTFKGWATSYQSETASHKAGETYTIKGDITFYGIWEKVINTYTVTFDGNGGKASKSSVTVKEGENIGTLPTGIMTNYELDGWYTEAEGGTKVTESTAVTSDMTLYAHWVGKTCLVSFSNPSFPGLTKRYGEFITLPTPEERDGYEFVGWGVSYYATEASYIAGEYYKLTTSTVEFFGFWEEKKPEKVSVSFDANGGSVSKEKMTFDVGSTYEMLPTATRTGYDFAGWYTEAEGGTEVTTTTVVTSDHTLYAHWSLKECLVGYENPNLDGEKLHYGDVLTLPFPTKDGYVFLGWADSYQATKPTINGGDKYRVTTQQTVFYGFWREKEITECIVSFDGNGGIPSRLSESVKSGKQYETLPTATREGYDFAGWYTEATGGTEVTTETTVISDHTLYARWTIKNCLVDFENPFINGQTLQYGDVITLPTPSKDGYVFLGWADSYQAHAPNHKGGDKYTVTAQQTVFYGFWEEKKPDEVTIIFDANGGIVDESSVTVYLGSSYGKFPTVTREGYDFAGWYTAAKGGTKISASATVTSNHTLFAQWTLKKCLISFENPDIGGQTLYYGDVITLPTPVKDGYVFLGWADSYQAQNPNYKGGDKYTVRNQQTVFYGFWEEKEPEQATVIFDANGGSEGESSVKVYVGSSYGKFPTVTRKGYDFAGWYTDIVGGTQITESTTVTSDHTLYAQWTLKECLVGYENTNLDGETVLYGDVITLPLPAKEGYVFLGWADSYQATKPSFIGGDKYKVTAQQTVFYGFWRKKEITECIVSFDGNGGIPSRLTESVKSGNQYGTLPTATRDGYDLEGWYTEANGGEKISVLSTVTSDHTLYAHWTLKKVMVSFSNPSITSLTMSYGEVLTLPTPEKKEGYVFLGWGVSHYATEASYEAGVNYTVTSSVDFYGFWVKKECTVSFDSLGGTELSSRKKIYGQPLILNDEPTKDGYAFKGWTLKSGSKEVVYKPGDEYNKQEDLTLYAVWRKKYEISYDTKGGTSVDSQIKIYGDDLELVGEPTKVGYTFKGWATSSKAKKVVYKPGEYFEKNKNKTLYAVWELKEISMSVQMVTLGKNKGKKANAYGVYFSADGAGDEFYARINYSNPDENNWLHYSFDAKEHKIYIWASANSGETRYANVVIKNEIGNEGTIYVIQEGSYFDVYKDGKLLTPGKENSDPISFAVMGGEQLVNVKRAKYESEVWATAENDEDVTDISVLIEDEDGTGHTRKINASDYSIKITVLENVGLARVFYLHVLCGKTERIYRIVQETDLYDKDSDGDGLNDGIEVENGLDPYSYGTIYSSHYTRLIEGHYISSDLAQDMLGLKLFWQMIGSEVFSEKLGIILDFIEGGMFVDEYQKALIDYINLYLKMKEDEEYSRKIDTVIDIYESDCAQYSLFAENVLSTYKKIEDYDIKTAQNLTALKAVIVNDVQKYRNHIRSYKNRKKVGLTKEEKERLMSTLTKTLDEDKKAINSSIDYFNQQVEKAIKVGINQKKLNADDFVDYKKSYKSLENLKENYSVDLNNLKKGNAKWSKILNTADKVVFVIETGMDLLEVASTFSKIDAEWTNEEVVMDFLSAIIVNSQNKQLVTAAKKIKKKVENSSEKFAREIGEMVGTIVVDVTENFGKDFVMEKILKLKPTTLSIWNGRISRWSLVISLMDLATGLSKLSDPTLEIVALGDSANAFAKEIDSTMMNQKISRYYYTSDADRERLQFLAQLRIYAEDKALAINDYEGFLLEFFQWSVSMLGNGDNDDVSWEDYRDAIRENMEYTEQAATSNALNVYLDYEGANYGRDITTTFWGGLINKLK